MQGAGLCFLVLLLAPAALAAPVDYTATIDGIADAALLQRLTGVSDTLAPDAASPASLLHLRRRAERDQARFMEVLQSQAHYGATVAIDLNPEATPVAARSINSPT